MHGSHHAHDQNLPIGFTLIELLVVIAIIGLLASIILASVYSARQQAERVTALANIKELQTALEIYITDTGFYPPDVVRGWDSRFGKASALRCH